MSATVEASSTPRRGNWVLLGVCWLAAFLPMLDTSIVNLALPQLAVAFGATPTALGWITNAYLIPLVVSIPVVARIGDSTDRARVLVTGAAIFAAASFGAALSDSWVVLLSMRALQGLGASALATTSMAIVSAAYAPGGDRQRAFGRYLSGPAFGGALGPIAGAALTALGGWRMMFAGQVPLAFVVVVLGPGLASASPRQRRPLDPAGIVLAVLTLLGLSVALLQGPSWGWDAPAVIGAWGMFALGALAFAAHERRTPHPLVAPHVFARRSFVASGVAGGGIWFAIISGFILLPLYLESLRGLDPMQASLLIAAWPLGALVMYPMAGSVVARGGVARTTQAALATILAAAVAMTLYGPHTPDAVIVVVGLFLGIATAVGQVATAAGAVAEFSSRDAGVASGMFNTVRQIGSIVGGAVPAALLSVDDAQGTSVTMSGLRSAFASRVVVLTVALTVVALVLRQPKRRPR